MSKINFLSFFSFMLFLGCANTYKLYKTSDFNFSESYYSSWSSGVRGGGSGFNIFLIIAKNSKFNDDKNKLEGIYFKGKYVKLKYQGLNKYQAFIKEKNNSDTLRFEDYPKNKTTTTKQEKIPFILKNNEAVIRYSINEKQHYIKTILTKKKTIDFPM